MKMTNNSLSIVIPMYQEVDNVVPMLHRVHEGLSQYAGNWELICVDDGSSDGTDKRLMAEATQYGDHVRIICFRRNFGQTAAMQAGIDAARGDIIATLDGDLQNDPADIPRMVAELYERDLDLLSGWRAKRQDHFWLRKFPSRIANWLIGKLTGVHIHDYGCSLKVYRADVLKEVRLFGEMHRFIPVWVASVTSPQRISETQVNHQAREHGTSKYGLSRTFRVIIDLLTVIFFLKYRARPGHFFGSIALILGASGSVIMSWLIVVKFGLGEDIGGRPLFFIGILLLVAAVQMLTTGIIAELLSRTFFGTSPTQGRHTAISHQHLDNSGWHSPSSVQDSQDK